MLYEFIALHRDDIVARTRARVRCRPWPSVSDREVEHGVPLFLTQLSETLRLEATAAPFPSDAIGSVTAVPLDATAMLRPPLRRGRLSGSHPHRKLPHCEIAQE